MAVQTQKVVLVVKRGHDAAIGTSCLFTVGFHYPKAPNYFKQEMSMVVDPKQPPPTGCQSTDPPMYNGPNPEPKPDALQSGSSQPAQQLFPGAALCAQGHHNGQRFFGPVGVVAAILCFPCGLFCLWYVLFSSPLLL